MSLWDLHDVIGAKPQWFLARCLDDYFAGWEDTSYSLPSATDDEFYATCVELLAVKETACQCDFADPSFEAAQTAAEAKPDRAEPRKLRARGPSHQVGSPLPGTLVGRPLPGPPLPSN